MQAPYLGDAKTASSQIAKLRCDDRNKIEGEIEANLILDPSLEEQTKCYKTAALVRISNCPLMLSSHLTTVETFRVGFVRQFCLKLLYRRHHLEVSFPFQTLSA